MHVVPQLHCRWRYNSSYIYISPDQQGQLNVIYFSSLQMWFFYRLLSFLKTPFKWLFPINPLTIYGPHGSFRLLERPPPTQSLKYRPYITQFHALLWRKWTIFAGYCSSEMESDRRRGRKRLSQRRTVLSHSWLRASRWPGNDKGKVLLSHLPHTYLTLPTTISSLTLSPPPHTHPLSSCLEDTPCVCPS